MAEEKIDIYKAGAILIQDRKLFLARTRGRDFFASPGGKIDDDETYEEALIRELKEELDISVTADDFEKFGTYTDFVINDKSKKIQQAVFLVKSWQGELKPSGEIEEIQWVGSVLPKNMSPDSIFEREVIPRLKNANIID